MQLNSFKNLLYRYKQHNFQFMMHNLKCGNFHFVTFHFVKLILIVHNSLLFEMQLYCAFEIILLH